MCEDSKLEQSQAWDSQFDSRDSYGIDSKGIDYTEFENADEDEDITTERVLPSVFRLPSETDVDNALLTFCSPLTDDDPFEDEEDIVQIFCREALTAEGSGDGMKDEAVALIYECEVDKGRSGKPTRHYTSELTATQVHEHLAKKRIRSTERRESPEPEVAIRRIYMDSLTSGGIRSLAATASTVEARVLPFFIFHHLQQSPTPLISAEMQGDSEHFSLQFHLPFLRLRKHERDRGDPRRLKGKPLRPHLDVSFMEDDYEQFSKRRTILYSSTVSCLVTGISTSDWSGYLVVDTHHEEQKQEKSQKVKHFVENRGDDPFTLGRCRADDSSLDPRAYWFIVLACWFRRIRAEWRMVVQYFKAISEEPDYGRLKQHIPQLTALLVSMRKFLAMLSNSASAWRMFYELNSRMFNRPREGPHYIEGLRNRKWEKRSLRQIQSVSTALGGFSTQLKLAYDDLDEIRGRIREEERTSYSKNNIELATTTTRISSTTANIAILGLISVPWSISSSMMSIPGIFGDEPTFKLYIGLSLCLMAFYGVIYVSVERQWPLIRDLLEAVQQDLWGRLARHRRREQPPSGDNGGRILSDFEV